MPKAGFDAVKFQTYITEDLVHELTNCNYQKSANFKNQFEMLKKYSLKFDQFLKLKKICDRMNIEFISHHLISIVQNFKRKNKCENLQIILRRFK